MDDPRDIAVALLEFEHQLHSCNSAQEVAFTAVNDSFSVLTLDQAVIWRRDVFNRPIVIAASGLAEVNAESPYTQWMGKAIRSLPDDPSGIVKVLKLSDLPDDLAAAGADWCHEHLLHCTLKGPDGLGRGGLLLSRNEPFEERDVAVAEWIARAVGYGLWAWRRERRRILRLMGGRRGVAISAATLVALALLGAIPVQLNALAPAEITPKSPIPVTSPVEGIIKGILIKPNQIVKAGETLVELDDTSLRNRLAVASKTLEIATADSQRAINKAFFDESSRSELQVLRARVREKSTEVAYTSDLLQRLKIEAPQGGVAIFANSEEWTGKPVQTGERIMTIADPSLIRVTIFVPPEDAVELETGADVSVFLNTRPLDSLAAKIMLSSYEALPQPDGTLAYIVQAELMPGHGFPRIGLRGTAKVYAGKVSLAYYLFRKPIAFLRRSVGV
jgi:hypothetical protein